MYRGAGRHGRHGRRGEDDSYPDPNWAPRDPGMLEMQDIRNQFASDDDYRHRYGQEPLDDLPSLTDRGNDLNYYHGNRMLNEEPFRQRDDRNRGMEHLQPFEQDVGHRDAKMDHRYGNKAQAQYRHSDDRRRLDDNEHDSNRDSDVDYRYGDQGNRPFRPRYDDGRDEDIRRFDDNRYGSNRDSKMDNRYGNQGHRSVMPRDDRGRDEGVTEFDNNGWSNNRQSDMNYNYSKQGQRSLTPRDDRDEDWAENTGYLGDGHDNQTGPFGDNDKSRLVEDPRRHRMPPGGYVNAGYNPDEDADNDSLIHVHMRRRSVRHRHRRSRRSGHVEEDRSHGRHSFADNVKTLVGRKKLALSRARASHGPTSELGHGGHTGDDELYDALDGEDRLPSNRLTKTKTLKVKLDTLKDSRDATTHDMAGFLRDQILTKEQSQLRGLDHWRYQTSKQWTSFKNWLNNVVYELELWSGAFKVIEGHFGTSTMSYFRFMRWLMFLNLFMAVFMVTIVVLPFVLVEPSKRSEFPRSVNECQSKYHHESVVRSGQYVSVMEIQQAETVSQEVVDVLQGTGWMETTLLFYGAYYNRTVTLSTDNTYIYNMGLAYLLAVVAAFLLSFVLLVKNSAKGFKQSLVLSSSGTVTLYCNKVFAAWDYCISEEKTANLKRKNILQGFMNELEYQRLQWKKDQRTKMEKFKLYSVRLAINLFVIAILAAALTLIYITNQKLIDLVKEDNNEAVQLLTQYLPSVTITLLNIIVPIILNKVVIAEDYMPAFTVKITLTRTVLLRLASLGMMMVSLYQLLTNNQKSSNSYDDTTYFEDCNIQSPGTPGTTTLSPHFNDTEQSDAQINCWETYVGQQIYKLIFLNFIVVIFSTFAWEFPRKLIFSKFNEKLKLVALLGQQEFDLSKSVLDLVYLQTLCWLGVFFSPLVPAMCAVTCFIFFYVKKVLTQLLNLSKCLKNWNDKALSLMHNYLPTQKYGLSRSNSLFMLVLLLSFGLAVIPMIYMVGSISPSMECGPFRVYSGDNYKMFSAITNLADSWSEGREFLFFLGTSGFMFTVAFLLCFLMYYFYIVGQANYNMSKALKDQLKIEGQDKQFLLARVNEVLGKIEEQEGDEEDED